MLSAAEGRTNGHFLCLTEGAYVYEMDLDGRRRGTVIKQMIWLMSANAFLGNATLSWLISCWDPTPAVRSVVFPMFR